MDTLSQFRPRTLPCFSVVLAAAAALLVSVPITSSAESGTWLMNPPSNDWNTGANWSSGSVPGGLDAAFFNVSNQTEVSVSGNEILSVMFNPGASAFVITAPPGGFLDIGGLSGAGQGGVMNLSGVNQNFIALGGNAGSGGGGFLIEGSVEGQVIFTTGGATSEDGLSGYVQLDEVGSAGSGSYINEGGMVSGGLGGEMVFLNAANASSAKITNQGGTAGGAHGGTTTFLFGGPGANRATITSEGGTTAGAEGGVTSFLDKSHAGQATLIAEGGSNGGGGGVVEFQSSSTGGRATVQVYGNGSLDISAHDQQNTVEIGSLEGDGQVNLGRHRLYIGSNNRSTTFAGVIEGTGSISKVGTGTLTLTGANTYSGLTVVSEGELLVNSSSGSGTGSGLVRADAGTLGGAGLIAGAVRIGTGSGTGAILAPGDNGIAMLAIQKKLTFNSDGTYDCELDTNSSQSDAAVAKGVTISSGATFSFQPIGNVTLPAGSVFTVISNTSSTPISGTFANLPDGATIASGGNTYKANYEGGDGNDLTLTVTP